jgi:hypothetical protein
VSSYEDCIKPGAHLTIFFTVKSPSLPLNSFKDTLLLPENWQILIKKITPLSENKTEAKYLYTLSTPKDLIAGSYNIGFELIANQKVSAFKFIPVNVDEVRKIEIVALNKPEFVKEGDTLRVSYMIQNMGNRPERVKLETNRGIIEGVKDSVYVGINSFRRVIVKQIIPIGYGSYWQTSSDLKAHLKNTKDFVYQAVTIPVYSTKIKKGDAYRRFPIEIGGGYLFYKTGERNFAGYQYAINGKGALDSAENHKLEFTIKGPNQFFFPAIGSYDEYGMRYNYKNKATLSVGDYYLRFNNLLESGRFGRGAKYEQDFGKFFINGFYQQARFFPGQKDAYGGSIGVKISKIATISLDYITKNILSKKQNFASNIIGSTINFKYKYWNIETEVAKSSALDKSDLGVFSRLSFSWKKLNLNSNLIYAGKNFYGFYTNSQLLINTLNFNITRKLMLGVTSSYSRINPSLDVNVYSTSPFSNSYQAFLNYQINEKNTVLVNFTRGEKEDRQTPSSFHYKEDYGNFNYNLNAKNFSLSFQSRYGFTQNLLVVDSLKKRQSISNVVQPMYRILPWFWLGGYLEHQKTAKFSALNIPQDLLYYGANVRIDYKNNVHLNFMYRNNYAPDEFFERKSFLDASLIFDTKYQTLSFTGGQSFIPNSNQNTLFFSVKNVWKINVPIARNKKLGFIKGQISTLNAGIKKEGIIVEMGGQKSITDTSGVFQFTKLLPDKYFLTLSKDNLTEGVVPIIKTPIEITVKADSTSFIKIPLIKTCNIIGTINFEKMANGQSVTSVSSKVELPIILIKLFNEKEEFLTQMNGKNEFTFKEMKPGIWKIAASIPGKQDQFLILNAEKTIEIEAGETKNIDFTVKPVERKIYIAPQSFKLSDKQ